MKSSRCLQIQSFGNPAEVLHVGEETWADLKPNEVRVKMLVASINPADINLIEGNYGVKPSLPAVVGNEGVGVVEEVGAEVHDLQSGDWVKLPEGMGCWREYAHAQADECLKFPSGKGLSAEQVAMLYVNPPTAWRMLHDFVDLPAGSWIVQNAGNSAVGRCVIQIAKAKGWHTLSLVRRAELVEELKALGADAVVVDDENAKNSIREIFGKTKARLGLNAVGGDSALSVADTLEEGASLVTYGAMSKQALKLPNAFLIFRDLRFCGFWMTRWYRQATKNEKETMLAELGEMMRAGVLKIAVHQTYPIDQVQQAIRLATTDSRAGKVLFTF